MKIIKTKNCLELNNQIITAGTTMKPMEYLLCLVVLLKIQNQMKQEGKKLGSICISKSGLKTFFKKDILRKSTFTKLINNMYNNHCFHLKDDTTLENLFLSLKYDGTFLEVEYDVDKIKWILINENKFTQLDVEYMCNNLTMSKNAIIMYTLVCYFKSFGKLPIKKETLLRVLQKDDKSNYPTHLLTRDIKRALEMFQEIIGEHKIEINNEVYTITFTSFRFIKLKHDTQDIIDWDDIL